jgi:two-component system, sensor histidine kinase and response regulator
MGTDKATLLLVDDNPANLQILVDTLRHSYELLTAQSGKRALEIAARNLPDLILLDIQMPGLSGFDTCRKFKQDSDLRDIPVIFISALHDVKDKVEGFEAGGVDYVIKPFEQEEVRQRIKTHLTIVRLRKDLQKQVAQNESLLQVLCHDMANLIGPVKGTAEANLFMGTVETGSSMELILEKIVRFTNRQVELIQHVREMRQITIGKKDIQLSAVSLGEVMDNVAEVFRQPLDEKNLQLHLPTEPSVRGLLVNAESTSLAYTVLNNLVSNAIKFSYPKNAIEITVNEYPDTVDIAVIDHGMGIPTELVARLFDPAACTSRPGTQSEPGTGFGMPLVRAYVERYRGSITVESIAENDNSDAHGTTVRVTLRKP